MAAVALWPREAEVEGGAEAEARQVRVFANVSLGDILLGDETPSAAGTLSASQCACVRPV